MARFLAVLFALCTCLTDVTFAEEEAISDLTFLDWLEKKDIEVRKSFSGTVKDAGAPASISYVNADDTSDFYSIDLAIRTADFGEWGRGPWQGRYIPIFEHHKSTKDESRLDKTSAGLNVEVERSVASCERERGSVAIPFCRTLLLDLAFALTRDSHNDKTTRSISLLATLWGDEQPWPSSHFTTSKNNLYLTWFPSIGFEFYESLPIERKEGDETVVVAPAVDETFAVAKMNFDFRPFTDRLNERLSLVGNYAFYDLVGSSTFLSNSNSNTSLSLNYYLDQKKRVAISLNYENGESPTRNFLNQEITSFGFSIKISP